MTIKRKVLVLIFAAILVAAGSSTLIGRTISKKAVEEEIGNLLTTIAQSKSLQIHAAVSDKVSSVESLAEVLATVISDESYQGQIQGRLDSPFVTYVLQRFKESNASIRDIVVWDEGGTLMTSTRPIENLNTTENMAEVLLMGKEKPSVGTIEEDVSGKEYVLYTSAPIQMNGERIGVVVLLNGVEDIFAITTDRTGLGKTGESYIVNPEGYLITPSRFLSDAAVLRNQLSLSDLKLDGSTPSSGNGEIQPGHKAVRAKNYLGDSVFRAYAALPDTGWIVVAEKGSSEAFEPVIEMTNAMLLVLLGLLGIGAIGAFLLSRTITRPIINLHRGVVEIMKGNLNHRIGAGGSDEIGQLSMAFDQMTANLQRTQRELEAYSAGLEKMVEKRTHELSLTNEELNREIEVRKKAEETLRKTNAQLMETMEQLKSSQAQLLQSEKLAAVGQLVSGVAHELNNPLMAINGYVELMEMYVEDPTAREDIQNLKTLSERATSVVRNLLSFARKQDPKREYVSVNEAIKVVIKLRAYELNLDNIEIVQELDPEIPKTMADFQQLQQVFLNLLVNAEQAMRDAHGRGRLVIRSERVGNIIRITFTDDGPGIPRDIINRIFEPFFTTKPVGKGTGLGLSICYGIIREHGGKIYVTSKEGEGATFTVELPIISKPVECASTGEPSNSTNRGTGS